MTALYRSTPIRVTPANGRNGAIVLNKSVFE